MFVISSFRDVLFFLEIHAVSNIKCVGWVVSRINLLQIKRLVFAMSEKAGQGSTNPPRVSLSKHIGLPFLPKYLTLLR